MLISDDEAEIRRQVPNLINGASFYVYGVEFIVPSSEKDRATMTEEACQCARDYRAAQEERTHG